MDSHDTMMIAVEKYAVSSVMWLECLIDEIQMKDCSKYSLSSLSLHVLSDFSVTP